MHACKSSVLVVSLAFVLAGFGFGGNAGSDPLQMGLAYAQLPPAGPGGVAGPGSGIGAPGDIGSVAGPGEVGGPGGDISAPGDNNSLGSPGDAGIPEANSSELGPGYLSGSGNVSQPVQNTTSAVPEFGPVASVVLFVAVMAAVLLGSGMKFRGPSQSGN